MTKTTYIIFGALVIIIIIATLYIRHHIKTEVTASLKRKTAHLQEPLGVDIWCKNKPNAKKHLKKLFPEIQFFEWDFMTETPKDFDKNNPNHSIYFVKDHSKENALYPFELSLDNLSRAKWHHLAIYKLVMHIAKTENNRCWVEGGMGVHRVSFYPELLFDKDKIYVTNSDEFDNENTDVIIIKEINSIYD